MKVIKSNNRDIGCNDENGEMVCYGKKGHLINAQKIVFSVPGGDKPNSDYARLVSELKRSGTQIDMKDNSISATMSEQEAVKIADKFHVVYKI
jgi:hypothetical protein